MLDHKKTLPPGNRSTGPDPLPDQGRTQLSQEKERSRLPRLLFENPLHHAGADAERSADLENAVSVGSQLQYPRFDRRLNPAPAQLRTFRPSASKTRVYSFANDPTLELGKHAKHLKHRFARSRRSIESLLVEEQDRDPQIWPKKRPFWGCAWKPAFRGDWMVETEGTELPTPHAVVIEPGL